MSEQTAAGAAETEAWAIEEFGDADLGNKLRTARLVQMASRAAEKPAGALPEVFSSQAELEGAYRFVESVHVDHQAVANAAHRATARRSAGKDFVFVPVDGSNITVPWASGTEQFGPVGTSGQRVRGIEVMSAEAVTPQGTPLGLCGQQWWVRPSNKDEAKKKSKPRPLHKKETQHWLKCINQSEQAFESEGVTTRRWYQLDAGGDFREMLQWMATTDQLVTTRAAQDRRLMDSEESTETRYLWETLEAVPVLGTYDLTIPSGGKRQARTATIELLAAQVTLRLRDSWSKKTDQVTLQAVLAREVGTAPADEDPIEWLLLTNKSVESFDDARLVVYGYSLRWRIEAFHKTWKTTCGIEDTQLREPANVIIWATILATVAMRIERLIHLAREQPYLPATEELTEVEVDALTVLRKPARYQSGDVPTIGQAVLWIAELGGYRGKSSGGPPGAIVIGRGLRDLETAARVLNNLDHHVT